jgi:alpha-beta hydrolase superfamily lysophospholipase
MYLKISLGLVISFFVVLNTKAQHLRHKGSLGIEYTEASDSLLNAWKIVETRGILVKSVTLGYTAANLGIQPNDILVSVNNTDSLYLFDFKELEQNLQEKDPISITFIRKNRKNRVVGYVSAAPREKSVGEVSYDEVAYYRGYLRTIIHKPAGTAPFPTVFFVQDYDCSSIDFSRDTLSPTKQLVDGWVKAGYVVVRVEKPGVGESEGTKDCARIDFNEELTAFQNTYEFVKKLSFVDSTHVFLFGHSVGGITAPLVAAKAKYKPRGIIVYGTVIKPWFEYMLDVFRKQPVLFKESLQSIEVNTRMMTPLLYEWLVQGRSASELFSVPDFEAILTSKENPLNYYRGTFFGRSTNYFSDINRLNLTQTWAQVAVPTLAIHGEYDSQAISSEAAQSIAQIINELYPKKGSYKLLRGTDHSMVKVASFNEYQQLVRSGKYRQHAYNNFNPEIVEITVNWMKQQ